MIALVSALEARDLDTDLDPLAAAIEALGERAEVVCWDDPQVRWGRYDLVVLRSTWNYMRRLDDFLAWLAEVDTTTTLVNPIGLVHWSLDKHYLARLAGEGVPVVPSQFLEPGDDPTVNVDGDVVVKPAVSAGSNDTERFRPGQGSAATAHAARLLDVGRSVLIQPYQHAVDDRGETAVVCFGGKVSHAFGKGAILARTPEMVGGVFAAEEISARVATDAERAVAEQVLALVPGGADRLAYARIDLLPGPTGPLVLEMELAEPSVYLHLAPGSADRFAAVLVSRLRR